ncbi:MAG: nicotinate phosphoribosyltransferase [Candidatus Scalindua sp. AMX11]|nr:MAG: nicotinate phosphoribosyltransferase [Candidatus Scalindua sp.]NOG85406.1 nicotinate phosphoribosyltransferase [Planctomycetota bacterium]RZV84046.1 MAG: nicotinate phosphoribosyltransferase [Candidatus Scalindua sp. SCAELEC01]TDE65783.1 MAG: nicotinate phosphoribosyltransferase [Candidatus Scalindua sp. AMX11]GJQ58794.1 MAG: nicotinate phosphoribosyltransferase [Candidatus Scalindua sp.]
MGIATDLYQLTMAAGYFACKQNHTSTFELFVRKLPQNRSYLVAAGLEQAIYYLTNLSFPDTYVQYLQQLPLFKNVSGDFFTYLRKFRFQGDLFAVPEGTTFFANEPILRVTAPAIEAQIIETYLLSMICYQTLITSKASRVVHSAQGKEVIDFGTRRAHSPQAGVLAARASYIGGCVGTSNVLTAYELGIPAIGTIAHSWIMGYENEFKSFEDFQKVFPENTTLLIDTYDSIKGAQLAATIGKKLKGVRLDSGNISLLSKKVRRILDSAGLQQVKITASGDLNEYKISELLRKRAPIDSFGVGTEMVTSKDSPALNGVYKLVEQEVDGRLIPKMKCSEDKVSYPSKKQVYRFFDKSRRFKKDIVGLTDEVHDAEALLLPIIRSGKLLYPIPTVQKAQKFARENISHLPGEFKRLDCGTSYPVLFSKSLREIKERLNRNLTV